jgi:hypothetical protein
MRLDILKETNNYGMYDYVDFFNSGVLRPRKIGVELGNKICR